MLGANFKIKFQQYDNYDITTDGMGYDQIAISTPAPADDWYRLGLTAGQPTTVGLATLSSGSATVRLYDNSNNLLAAGVGARNLAQVIANFFPGSSGTYNVRVSGNDAAYSLVVTKGAGFDTESNDSLATAQDIGGNVTMLGYVGPASGGPTPLLHFMPGTGGFPRGTAPPSIGLVPGGGQAVHSDGPGILAAANAFGTTFDLYSYEQFLGRFALDTPQTLTNLGPQGPFIPAGDFDNSGDFSKAYAIDGDDNLLVQMDMATGALTTIGPITPYGAEDWTGMGCDPTSGIMYASSTDITASSLYTVNLTTGAATRIGAITNSPGTIALAVDDTGQIYGEDLVNDSLIRINKTTVRGPSSVRWALTPTTPRAWTSTRPANSFTSRRSTTALFKVSCGSPTGPRAPRSWWVRSARPARATCMKWPGWGSPRAVIATITTASRQSVATTW